jgi:hypothetical protein
MFKGYKMNDVELSNAGLSKSLATKNDAWLNKPKSEFSGSTPMEHGQNDAGYQQALEILERIGDTNC